MKNYLIALGILIFIIVTAVVMSSDSSKKVKRVKFVNEKVVIRNTNTEIESKTVEINSAGTNIKNTEIEPSKIAVKITNNESSLEDMTFRRDYKSKTSSASRENSNLDNYNRQLQSLNKIENRIKNPPPKPSINFNRYDDFRKEHNIPDVPDRYLDKNIDWNTWKSNFINRILDDSVYIKALDEYGLGAWFYYSFNVNSDGSITNVKVMSWYLNTKDKENVIKLIKSYAYKPITKFPAHTKKNTVKVDAAVMLGSSEKRAAPSDFNENERVRIKY